MSHLFRQILLEVCSGKVTEPFCVGKFSKILDKSPSFLSKHSIKGERPFDRKNGKPYFIWVSRGLYKINKQYKTCK